MAHDSNQYIYEPGPNGYGFTRRGTTADPSQESILVAFCKSIAWRPDKLDKPHLRCIAVIPAGDACWLCTIEESDRDQYGRNLTIKTSAQIFGIMKVASALETLAGSTGIDLKAVGVTESVNPIKGEVSIIGDQGLLNYYSSTIRPHVNGPLDAQIVEHSSQEPPMPQIEHKSATDPRSSTVTPTVLWILCGLITTAIIVGVWLHVVYIARIQSQLEREQAEHSVLKESVAAILVRGEEVTPRALQAYTEIIDQRDRISQELKAWKTQVAELFPEASRPTDLQTSVAKLRQELARASGDLSQEDRKRLNILRTSDELQRQLQQSEVTSARLRTLLDATRP